MKRTSTQGHWKGKDAMRSLEGWVFLKARISVSNSNVDLEFYKPFLVNQSTRSDLPAQFRFPRWYRWCNKSCTLGGARKVLNLGCRIFSINRMIQIAWLICLRDAKIMHWSTNGWFLSLACCRFPTWFENIAVQGVPTLPTPDTSWQPVRHGTNSNT